MTDPDRQPPTADVEDHEHDHRIAEIRRSKSYRQAHIDPDFMCRYELRPVRLQLELLKPELVMRDEGVSSTIVVFGGTRVLERAEADRRLRAARAALKQQPDDPGLQRAVRIARQDGAPLVAAE